MKATINEWMLERNIACQVTDIKDSRFSCVPFEAQRRTEGMIIKFPMSWCNKPISQFLQCKMQLAKSREIELGLRNKLKAIVSEMSAVQGRKSSLAVN